MVSVIVVCHNNRKVTERCLKALEFVKEATEIILVDNASTDDTQAWAAKQPIKYLRNQMNLGCGIARNQGAKWAAHDYLFFLDNDQFVSPNTIEQLLAVDRDLVGVEHWQVPDVAGSTLKVMNKAVGSQGYVGSGGLLIRAAVFDDLGGYDERYSPAWYEDVDLCFRARKAGYTIGWSPDAGIEHLGGTTIASQKSFKSGKAKSISRELFCRTWSGYIESNPGKKPLTAVPTINIIVDVRGWAWDFKAQHLKQYLSDEFNINIVYASDSSPKLWSDNNVWFSFEYFAQYERMIRVPYVTGVTAHTYVNFPSFDKYLKSATAIHANSRMLYEEIKTRNLRCFYLPNGVAMEEFPYYERDITQPFTVGYVGKGTKRKGFDKYIVPACNAAGVGLKAQVGKYKDPNVINHSDMHEFYQDIDCVIIASDMDGTPNQLLEAASVGRTFVGNAIGNVPEFLDVGSEHQCSNGFMVQRSIDAYVEQLVWLKEHRIECAAMGLAARETVEQGWTWQIQAENYREMFRSLV